ncbi:epimerase [Bacteriovorax stolpii]|uniref:NAD-dependent epimerase/dehydratase family protein n=1 Tax=Bacteriovorax stolpii TaxID=960 RepID=UPI00115C2AD9|nr:NAD-dependent epimerase/dehydratase family protein [Bacteriovorax stolpii]QDK43248.1 epimerase [Bacteriovorax stolpii]
MNLNWNGKRVFVSGGAGVIGRELVQVLVSKGASVFVGDLKAMPAEWLGKVKYRQGDLNTLEGFEIESFSPEIFIHLAATFERSKESYDFWDENYNHNVNLSHHLMSVMKNCTSLSKVIFASSYLIYDPKLYLTDRLPEKAVNLRETDPIYPRNLTGVAKLSHEIELRFLNEFLGAKISFTSARIYRSYGLNSRDIISRWVRALLQGQEIELWGEDSLFDYIFARDVANGLLKICESSNDTIINLGSGKSKRVSEVIAVLKKHFPEAKIKNMAHSGAYECSQADLTQLQKSTGWVPEYSIETAIPEIIAFEKNRLTEKLEVSDFNVLITSASKKIPLLNQVKTSLKSFGKGKVFVGDVDPNCFAKYFADDFWQMPYMKDLTAQAVVDFCKSKNIKLIIPTRDGELNFWSKNREYFSDNSILVAISDLGAIENCFDKFEFFNFCKKKSIPAIPTYLSPDEMKDATTTRWVVKERFGAGSKSVGINLTYEQLAGHASQLENPIYQPYVAGKEISADAYVNLKGEVLGVVLRTRDVIVNGESQITTTFRDEKIEVKITDALKGFSFYGHVVLQAIIKEDSQLEIIEINPRFGGASTTSIKAGLNTFTWLMNEVQQGKNAVMQFDPIKSNLRQVRFAQDYVTTWL